MEGLRTVRGMALLLGIIAMAVMLPEVGALRWIVGSSMGWSPNVNYTVWAQGKHFYNGEWLCKLSFSSLYFLLQIYYVTADALLGLGSLSFLLLFSLQLPVADIALSFYYI